MPWVLTADQDHPSGGTSPNNASSSSDGQGMASGFNPFASKRSTGCAEEDKTAGGSGSVHGVVAWNSGTAGYVAALLQEDDSSPSSEEESSSEDSVDLREEMNLDALKRQVHDMGRQIWQMQIDRKELEKLRNDRERRINELTEELAEKKSKLSESRHRTEVLVEMQTKREEEKEQLKCNFERSLKKLREEVAAKNRNLSDSKRRTEQLEMHVKELEARLQGTSRSSFQYGETTTTAQDNIDFGRPASTGPYSYCKQSSSFPNSATAANPWQGSSSETASRDESVTVPEHLKKFSPLAMGRRSWNRMRRIG